MSGSTDAGAGVCVLWGESAADGEGVTLGVRSQPPPVTSLRPP